MHGSKGWLHGLWAHVLLLPLQVQFQVAKPHEVEELTELRAALSDRNAPTRCVQDGPWCTGCSGKRTHTRASHTRADRDSRGFRKLILATTTCGKVVALHNGDGHVVWARPFPPATAPQVSAHLAARCVWLR